MSRALILTYFLALLVMGTSLYLTGNQIQREPDSTQSVTHLMDTKEIELQVHEMQALVEEALAWRFAARDFADAFIKKIENGDSNLGHDLREVERGVKTYVAIRKKLLERFAERYRHYFEGHYKISLKSSPGTRVTTRRVISRIHRGTFDSKGRHIAQNGTPINHYTIELDPHDELGQNIIKQIKISLAAALTLYDNYLVAIAPITGYDKIRRLVNFDNPETEKEFEKATRNYIDRTNRKVAQRAILFYEKLKSFELSQDDPQDEYLNLLVESSLSYNTIKNYSFFDVTPYKIRFARTWWRDYLSEFNTEVMDVLSKIFGNTVGLVETRKGKLYNQPKIETEVKHNLKALDVLLEKTPFRLTDKFIPGHYGHVAVWMGSEQELREIGIWEELPWEQQQMIRDDRKVLEALRPGVTMNKLSHFMNIDDLAVLRPVNLPKLKIQTYLRNGFELIGKSYDFNFDVTTRDKIVCSEVAYHVFGDFKWPTEKALGRITISPDNVAQLAIEPHDPFQVVELYHDGIKIQDNVRDSFLRLLDSDKNKTDKIRELDDSFAYHLQFLGPSAKDVIARSRQRIPSEVNP